jgi:hypothetical protein
VLAGGGQILRNRGPGWSVIAALPPSDGRDWDNQCARCGSSVASHECWSCGGEGTTYPGESYEEDPLWYDQDDVERCQVCNGIGRWWVCLSDWKWCEDHPLPGRENVERGRTEWWTHDEFEFVVDVGREVNELGEAGA